MFSIYWYLPKKIKNIKNEEESENILTAGGVCFFRLRKFSHEHEFVSLSCLCNALLPLHLNKVIL